MTRRAGAQHPACERRLRCQLSVTSAWRNRHRGSNLAGTPRPGNKLSEVINTAAGPGTIGKEKDSAAKPATFPSACFRASEPLDRAQG